MSSRRQLSLFLPQPEGGVVDAVRERLDPRQHALIPAHVTLCREDELEPWAPVEAVLERLDSVDVSLSFANPQRLDDGALLLAAQGSTAEFDDLRRLLLGSGCRRPLAHITLLHPRHAAGRQDDLLELAKQPLPRRVRWREIVLIEQQDGAAWRTLARYPRRSRPHPELPDTLTPDRTGP